MKIKSLEKVKFLLRKLDIILGVGILIGVSILILIIAHKAVFDPDIWLHLKTGQIIFENKTVPSKDIFSFTVAGKPWTDHEWLFQLISYSIFKNFGENGLITLQVQIIILSFLVLFLMGYREIKSFGFVAMLILIIGYVSSVRFNIRPDIFSMLFFSLYLYALRFHINKRLIYLLIPIQILWVNIHGYFFLGPLLILLFILAEFLRRKIKFLPWQWKEQFVLKDAEYSCLKKLFLFTVLACLINPNFLKGALYPLWIFKDILTGKTQIFFEHIQELKPTFKIAKYLAYSEFYYILPVFCFLLMLINFKKLRIVDVILFLLFFLFSFRVRNIAFFSFVIYSIMIYYLAKLIQDIPFNIKLEIPLKKAVTFLFKNGIKILIIMWLVGRINKALISGYYNFDTHQFETKLLGVLHELYPKKAVDFVLEHKIPGNMLNDFNSGAYLVYRTYPKRRVFIDGRTEVYGPEIFKQSNDIYEGNVSVFEAVINKYNVTAILFSLTRGSIPKIMNYIYKSPEWRLFFFDEAGIVFLKDTPINKELIDKYAIDLKNYIAPKADLKNLISTSVYPRPYTNRATLFNLLGEDALAILELKEALRIMPVCSYAYNLLGEIYYSKKQYSEAMENFRFAVLFAPRYVEAITNLGSTLWQLKEAWPAINTLKKAIKIKPDYADAYYHLGTIYLGIDNEPEAIQLLNKATKFAPGVASYHHKLAEALYKKGKRLKDISYIMKAKKELNLASQLNIQNKQDLAKEIKDHLKEIEDYLSSMK